VPKAKPASANAVPEELILQFASAVRWNKPWSEIQAVIESAGGNCKSLCAAKDPKNGNTAVHIAAQNGHLELLQRFVSAGADLNVQNGKGQSPLHMSVEYDFYFVSRFLIEAGADRNISNQDGHKAITGIEGGKVGKDAWDNQVTMLRSANTAEELNTAFDELEKAVATPEMISKEQLIQVGLAKKKSHKDVWDHKRFMGIAAKF
jgi:hypothetical protein